MHCWSFRIWWRRRFVSWIYMRKLGRFPSFEVEIQVKWHPLQSQGGQQCKSTVLFVSFCNFMFFSFVIIYYIIGLLKRMFVKKEDINFQHSKMMRSPISPCKANGAKGEDLSESSKKVSHIVWWRWNLVYTSFWLVVYTIINRFLYYF